MRYLWPISTHGGNLPGRSFFELKSAGEFPHLSSPMKILLSLLHNEKLILKTSVNFRFFGDWHVQANFDTSGNFPGNFFPNFSVQNSFQKLSRNFQKLPKNFQKLLSRLLFTKFDPQDFFVFLILVLNDMDRLIWKLLLVTAQRRGFPVRLHMSVYREFFLITQGENFSVYHTQSRDGMQRFRAISACISWCALNTANTNKRKHVQQMRTWD